MACWPTISFFRKDADFALEMSLLWSSESSVEHGDVSNNILNMVILSASLEIYIYIYIIYYISYILHHIFYIICSIAYIIYHILYTIYYISCIICRSTYVYIIHIHIRTSIIIYIYECLSIFNEENYDQPRVCWGHQGFRLPQKKATAKRVQWTIYLAKRFHMAGSILKFCNPGWSFVASSRFMGIPYSPKGWSSPWKPVGSDYGIFMDTMGTWRNMSKAWWATIIMRKDRQCVSQPPGKLPGWTSHRRATFFRGSRQYWWWCPPLGARTQLQ